MAIWIVAIIISALIGGVAGLLENWARGDPIPNFRIVTVGVIAALVGGVVPLVIVGRFIPAIAIVLTLVALLVDRTAADMRRGL